MPARVELPAGRARGAARGAQALSAEATLPRTARRRAAPATGSARVARGRNAVTVDALECGRADQQRTRFPNADTFDAMLVGRAVDARARIGWHAHERAQRACRAGVVARGDRRARSRAPIAVLSSAADDANAEIRDARRDARTVETHLRGRTHHARARIAGGYAAVVAHPAGRAEHTSAAHGAERYVGVCAAVWIIEPGVDLADAGIEPADAGVEVEVSRWRASGASEEQHHRKAREDNAHGSLTNTVRRLRRKETAARRAHLANGYLQILATRRGTADAIQPAIAPAPGVSARTPSATSTVRKGYNGTMLTSRTLLFLAIALLAVTAPRRDAHACSPPPACLSSTRFPDGASIPANAPAVESWPHVNGSAAMPTADSVHLEHYDGTAWSPVTATVTLGPESGRYLVTPGVAFLESERYRLITGQDCSYLGAIPEFTTGPAAPMPTALGTLHATEPASQTIQGGVFVGGICAYPVQAMVSIVSIDLAADAAPWSAHLFYEVRVDGQPFAGLLEQGPPGIVAPRAGSTYHGRGTARLSVACAAAGFPEVLSPEAGYPFDSSGLTQGDHAVLFRARVAGTDRWIESAPITVTLRCPPTADAGLMDAGATGDAGRTVSGGGGCHVASPGNPTRPVVQWSAAMLCVAAVAVRRRRASR